MLENIYKDRKVFTSIFFKLLPKSVQLNRTQLKRQTGGGKLNKGKLAISEELTKKRRFITSTMTLKCRRVVSKCTLSFSNDELKKCFIAQQCSCIVLPVPDIQILKK